MRIWIGVRILSTVERKYLVVCTLWTQPSELSGPTTLEYFILAWYIRTFSYGNLLWGKSYQKHIRKIETLQKKAIRIINIAKEGNTNHH